MTCSIWTGLLVLTSPKGATPPLRVLSSIMKHPCISVWVSRICSFCMKHGTVDLMLWWHGSIVMMNLSVCQSRWFAPLLCRVLCNISYKLRKSPFAQSGNEGTFLSGGGVFSLKMSENQWLYTVLGWSESSPSCSGNEKGNFLIRGPFLTHTSDINRYTVVTRNHDKVAGRLHTFRPNEWKNHK